MKFTEAELKLVRRLKERERTWRWARWVFLLLGLLMIASSSVFFISVWKELRQEQLLQMLVAVVAPVCCLFLLVGVMCVGYGLFFWRGRPMTKLLFRLMEGCNAHE